MFISTLNSSRRTKAHKTPRSANFHSSLEIRSTTPARPIRTRPKSIGARSKSTRTGTRRGSGGGIVRWVAQLGWNMKEFLWGRVWIERERVLHWYREATRKLVYHLQLMVSCLYADDCQHVSKFKRCFYRFSCRVYFTYNFWKKTNERTHLYSIMSGNCCLRHDAQMEHLGPAGWF